MTVHTFPARRWWRDMLVDATLAGSASGAALAWRGRAENQSPAAPVNAVSHWLWGDKALARDRPSLRYTASGALVHGVSSMLWGAAFAWLRRRRRRPTLANAAVDAAAVSALASVVDLQLVPPRLTPGFERRLSKRSLLLVYGAFAAGLLLAAGLSSRR